MAKKKNRQKESKGPTYLVTPKGFFEDVLGQVGILESLLVFVVTNGYNAVIWNEATKQWEWGLATYVKNPTKRRRR